MEKRLLIFNVNEIFLCAIIQRRTAAFKKVRLDFGVVPKGTEYWDGQEFEICECKGSV